MRNTIKILNVCWFTQMAVPYNTLGIVTIENEMGERKAYLGTASGKDMQKDMEYIVDYGARLRLTDLEETIRLMRKEAPGESKEN